MRQKRDLMEVEEKKHESGGLTEKIEQRIFQENKYDKKKREELGKQ